MFLFYHKKMVLLIILKYITDTWLFKMTKSMWVIFNSFWRLSCLSLVYIHPYLDLEVYQLYAFPICTTWEGGTGKDQLYSRTCLFCWCAYSWYQPNCRTWNLIEMSPSRSDLLPMSSEFNLKSRVIMVFFSKFCSSFFKRH